MELIPLSPYQVMLQRRSPSELNNVFYSVIDVHYLIKFNQLYTFIRKVHFLTQLIPEKTITDFDSRLLKWENLLKMHNKLNGMNY